KGLTKNPKKVNILGLVPALDPFWRGNLIEVKRLLKELGIEANTFFTHFDQLDSLKNSSEASLNIVFSEVNGIGAAKAYEEIHEIPYVNLPLPIGPDATDEFLRFIAQKFDVENELLEKVIREEKEYYYGYIQNVADIYNDLDLQRHAIIVGNADYAYAVTKFVTSDFGWIPYFTAVTDILEDDEKEKVKKAFESFNEDLKPYLVFETDTSIIASKLKEKIEEEKDSYGSPISPAFVLGSTLDRSLANELKAGFLSVTYPVTNRVVTDQGYTGYRGGLRLANDILSSLLSNR
ncbi:MAG TPA: nitrogenase component 1, partial [Clostridia bacterium]